MSHQRKFALPPSRCSPRPTDMPRIPATPRFNPAGRGEAERAIVDSLTDAEINALLQIASDEDAEVRNEEIDYALDLDGSGASQDGGGQAQEGAAGTEARGDLAGGPAPGAENAAEIDDDAGIPRPVESQAIHRA